MIEVLHRSSMPPSALPPFNNNPLGNQQTRPPLRAIVNGPNGSTIKGQPERVASWIEDTRRNSNGSAPAHSYLQTPPGTDVVSVNSMLAPMYGGLYRGNSYSGYSNNIPTRQSSPPIPSISPRTKDDHPSCRDGIESIDGTNQIVSYLQIPPSINNSKGSLSEFAAQITCLFWFESSFTLHRVEEAKSTPTPMTPLVDEAKPTMGFRKWVTTILSTTQVSQNVIILALMFIYRLKKLNPTVKGKAGSEYRLLTVALMLGNKFLDDNTYTNKTWSEVSGISVTEIHIMEVEFLSNMRYTLYTSDREWESWHRQLGRFWDYFDRASRTPTESRTLTALGAGQVALPSPPASQHASPNFMPMGSNSAVNGVNGVNRLHPMSMPPYLAPSIPPPAPRMPDIDLRPNNRKRSMDENSDEPYAKRPAVSRFHSQYNPVDLPTIPNGLHHNPLADIQPPRLPMPNPTNNSSMMYNGSYANLLPPPATRAMSTVYGQAQRPHPGESNPMPQAMSAGIRIPPMNDPMQSRLPTTLSTTSKSSSPTSLNLTPTTLSPSGYHFQRNSPYRPVRGVNTLLVPPPPASFHNPSQNIDSGNMYYQPLGKPLSERRTGIVPFTAQQPPQHPLQFDHRYPFAPANHY